MQARLTVEYTKFSAEMDDRIEAICCFGRLMATGSLLIPPRTRDMDFQFRHALDAVMAKIELEKQLPEIQVQLEPE